MATLRLRTEGSTEITALPQVCMRCGAEATRTLHQTVWWFSRNPKSIAMPLCQKHLIAAQLLRFVPLAWSVGFFAIISPSWWVKGYLPPNQQTELLHWQAVAMLVWSLLGVARIYFQFFGYVRPVERTEKYVVFKNVAPEFVAAVERQAEEFRERLTRQTEERFDPSARPDDRIVPGADDAYQAG
jgi:hypothetical protein